MLSHPLASTSRGERLLTGVAPTPAIGGYELAFSLLRTARNITTDRTIIQTANSISLLSLFRSLVVTITYGPIRTEYTYRFVRRPHARVLSTRDCVVERRHSYHPPGMPNCFVSTTLCICMDDIDSDTTMVAAGVVISLIAAVELYLSWKNSRDA